MNKNYQVLSMLGEGGFGKVYLAEDILVRGRKVAIKSLKTRETEHEKTLIREMKHLADLNHQHVVCFYHHFRDRDTLFLVMEFCERGSLRDLWLNGHEFNIEDVPGLFITLCRTLQAIHGKGIVHHDLKPDNVLFGIDDIPKIGDFGIANTRFGTRVYMAPELFIPAERISKTDGRVDIYALGLTMLEMLTGTNPFFDLFDEDALQLKIQLNFLPDSLSSWLKEVLLKALQPKPELRFQTMAEFEEALTSRYVPYVFSKKRILAHRLAEKAEWHFKRKRWLSAIKIVNLALGDDSHCVSALITAGRCYMAMRRIDAAIEYFEEAIRINPRADIQKELGWIYLERGKYPEAISMLNDYLQRNPTDYEAYNLLLKTFYSTDRYEAAIDLAKTVAESCENWDCFHNNFIICKLLLGHASRDNLDIDTVNAFTDYNMTVFTEEPKSWDNGRILLKSKLLFQEFRFGDRKKSKPNTVVIEMANGQKYQFQEPIITIGRSEKNKVVMNRSSVSRRHCALINYKNDVWLYDLGSTLGTLCDDTPVQKPLFLESRHKIQVGDETFSILFEKGMLL